MFRFSKQYTLIPFKWRVTFVAILNLLLFTIQLATSTNTTPVVIGVSIIFVVFELFYKSPNHFKVVLTWVINTFLLGTFSYTLYTVFSTYYPEGVISVFTAGIVFGLSLIFTFILGYMVWWLGSGSLLVNLLFVYALYDVTLMTTFQSLALINTLLPLVAALTAGGAYILLNVLVWRKRNKFTPNGLTKTKLGTNLQKELETQYENISSHENYFVITGNQTALIVPVAGETTQSVSLAQNRLTIDNVDQSWFLEQVTLWAKEYSRTTKTPERKVNPIIVVHRLVLPESSVNRSVVPVTVRKRNKPQHSLGTVLITSKNKLGKVLSSLND